MLLPLLPLLPSPLLLPLLLLLVLTSSLACVQRACAERLRLVGRTRIVGPADR